MNDKKEGVQDKWRLSFPSQEETEVKEKSFFLTKVFQRF